MIKVETYAELNRYIEAFGKGLISLLVLEGKAGTGKSSLAQKVMQGKEHIWLSAHVTGLEMFRQMYFNRDKLVCIDDCDEILSNKINISLLKQLTESKAEKELSYFSTAQQCQDIPQKFTTTSKTLILCNSWKKISANLEALSDRAHHIRFCPSKDEVLNYIQQEIEVNPAVFDFLVENKNKAETLSVRDYIKATELFQMAEMTGLDWKAETIKLLKSSDKLAIIKELVQQFRTDVERLAFWEWSRASYYIYKRKLESLN